MATYILRRKYYASVRNPYLERLNMMQGNVSEDDSVDDVESSEESSDDTVEHAKSTPKKVEKAPVYQNLNQSVMNKVNNAVAKNKNTLRNKNVNQNVNINKTTNINNSAKEKEVKTNAQLKMAELQQKQSKGGGVNEKLIEIQKTNPLKPLSMNK